MQNVMVRRLGAIVLQSARETIRGGIVELDGLSRGLRWLIQLGYGALLVALAAVVLFDATGSQLAQASLQIPRGEGEITALVPQGVLIASSIAFAFGWTFLLTGASDCRKRIFLPIVGLFLIQLLTTTAASAWQSLGGALHMLIALTVIALAVLRLVAPRFGLWRDRPVFEFLMWLAILSVHMAMLWLFAGSRDEIARAMQGTLDLLFVLVVPFFLLLGLDAAEGVIDSARSVVVTLRRVLTDRTLHRWMLPFLAARAILGGLLISFNEFWVLDLFLGTLLLAGALVCVAAKRWTVVVALRFLWGSLISLIFVFFLGLAMHGESVNDIALKSTGLFSPALLFALLLLYDVLTFGKRYASTDGQLLPRSGRLLLYLGSAMLVTAFTLHNLNLRHANTGQMDQNLQTAAGSIAAISLFALGPLHLLWLSWRRRHDLIGPAPSTIGPWHEERSSAQHRAEKQP